MDSMPDDLDLDSLLFPEQLSLEEERNSSLAVSEYLINNSDSIDLSLYDKIIEVNTNDLIEHKEFSFTKIDTNKLFEILNSKTEHINPQLFFPKIKHLNDLFWFLHNLNNMEPYNSKIIFNTNNEISELSNTLIEAAIFFQFFDIVDENSNTFIITTSDFKTFKNKNIEEQYLLFLQNIGADKTARECITIQLNDPIYDKISRKMIFNKLIDNHNIQEEHLANNDITAIVNNVRYWYLDIRKYLL